MEEKAVITITCSNPDCRKGISVGMPPKSGKYNVTCPYCGAKAVYELKGLDASQASNPDNSGKPLIDLKDDFLLDDPVKFTCPHCGVHKFEIPMEKPGYFAIQCPDCKGKIGFNVRSKTRPLNLDEMQRLRGKLILLRKGWLNKSYSLSDGKNIVGRYDESAHSDIAVKNDSTMSRRSVQIDMNLTDKGYMFKLTVLKAANPVLHNGSPLMVGESVSLNFGDTILLGKTKFRFEKEG